MSPHPAVAAVGVYSATAYELATIGAALERARRSGCAHEASGALEARRAELAGRLEHCHREVVRCLNL